MHLRGGPTNIVRVSQLTARNDGRRRPWPSLVALACTATAAFAQPTPPPAVEGPRLEAPQQARLVPYRGGFIPPGGRLISKPQTKAATFSLVVFAAGYATSFFAVGALSEVARGGLLEAIVTLSIPIFGSSWAARSLTESPSHERFAWYPLAGFLLQAVGMGIAVVTHAMPEKWLVLPVEAPAPAASDPPAMP